MTFLFGLAILILLAAGLYFQRRQKKEWIADERYDDSGDWLDKRAGERGTYGTLDAAREQARKSLTREGQTIELARLLRDYFFENYPGFHQRSDRELKTFTTNARKQAALLFSIAENLLNGQLPEIPLQPLAVNVHILALKKIMLDFTYTQFPKLLDLEIETLKRFDQVTEHHAEALTRM